ncbi:hypothetical protein, partial [[Ruminococcus] torques]|uniref:hypothetical protein n=1 Tax=[Ruminococcus] torques TaxID=33039 RepID=UPI001D07B9D2
FCDVLNGMDILYYSFSTFFPPFIFRLMSIPPKCQKAYSGIVSDRQVLGELRLWLIAITKKKNRIKPSTIFHFTPYLYYTIRHIVFQ